VARQVAARRKKRRLTILASVIAAVLVIVGGVSFAVYQVKHKKSGSSASADPATALATKPVVTAGTGTVTELVVTTLIKGSGKPVVSGQTLSVNYVGVSYPTGKEFDSSWSRSQPLDVAIGQGKVIEGWDKGLVGVAVGSRVQLDIPSAMAYGDDASGGAPAGPLRFVVDVLSAT
jgi:peptidylprolyl isomerase